ncbi:MAG: dUTP diphosphatase [Deltaproteobacteria bacterium]|nr:dUTP diphosphatase [Deltaproteobacteria bacterium]
MKSEIKVQVKRIRPEEDQDLPLPAYMTPRSAGMDLLAAVKESVVMEPGQVMLIPTGLAMALPSGFEAQIRPRSGLALKKGLSRINSPGTSDADYRGEIGLAVINLGQEPVTIKRGDRIAQMIFTRVWQAELDLVSELEETDRGPGGFGHTG